MSKIFFVSLLAVLGLHLSATAQTETTTTTEETTTNSSTATSEEARPSKISKGGLFVEPILSATRQDSNIKTSAIPFMSDTSGKSEGYGLGARFGVHASEILFIGADARYQKLELRDSTYETASGNAYNYGATAGLQTPLYGVRLTGTYVLGGEFNPGAGAQGVDLKFRDPRGWRAGAGVHIAAVAVTLEYEDLVYDKTDIESFGAIPGSAQTNVDFTSRGYLLSLSFPIEL